MNWDLFIFVLLSIFVLLLILCSVYSDYIWRRCFYCGRKLKWKDSFPDDYCDWGDVVYYWRCKEGCGLRKDI